MKRPALKIDLAEAEGDVAQVRLHIRTQEAIIAEMERVGLETSESRVALKVLEESHKVFLAEVERTRGDVGKFQYAEDACEIDLGTSRLDGTRRSSGD